MEDSHMEGVRRRPGMYLGPTDERGLHACIYELVDSAIMEYLAGFGRRIDVSLNEDGSCSVRDFGRGIPVTLDPDTQLPLLEVLLTRFYYPQRDPLRVRVLGGVGSRVVNAVSERFEVESRRDGQVHRMVFTKGKPVEKLASRPIPAGEQQTGTLVTFKPDPEIFTVTTEFSQRAVSSRLTELAFLFPGLEFRLVDKRAPKPAFRWKPQPSLSEQLNNQLLQLNEQETPNKERFCYPNGLKDYLREYVAEHPENGPALLPEPVVISGEHLVKYRVYGEETARKSPMRVKVAFQIFEKPWSAEIISYCNGAETPDGGSHHEGMRFALLNTIRKLAKSARSSEQPNLIISHHDCLCGLFAVLTIEHPNPGYIGATKDELYTPEAEGIVNDIVSSGLVLFFKENPGIAKQIAERTLKSAVERAA